MHLSQMLISGFASPPHLTSTDLDHQLVGPLITAVGMTSLGVQNIMKARKHKGRMGCRTEWRQGYTTEGCTRRDAQGKAILRKGSAPVSRYVSKHRPRSSQPESGPTPRLPPSPRYSQSSTLPSIWPVFLIPFLYAYQHQRSSHIRPHCSR